MQAVDFVKTAGQIGPEFLAEFMRKDGRGQAVGSKIVGNRGLLDFHGDTGDKAGFGEQTVRTGPQIVALIQQNERDLRKIPQRNAARRRETEDPASDFTGRKVYKQPLLHLV